VFPARKVAVFIDGCFWHGCPVHGKRDHKVNASYWNGKIRRNRERDRETTERLNRAGWTVVRIWEHVPVQHAVAEVEVALER
jgi:DNA mismatch endonuclease (patch repair protein)